MRVSFFSTCFHPLHELWLTQFLYGKGSVCFLIKPLNAMGSWYKEKSLVICYFLLFSPLLFEVLCLF